MAFTRKDEFIQNDQQIAEWCKALAHPARIAILKTLANRKECICGDLVLDLPLAQSTVSQHLKALKNAGLIKGVLDGQKSRYCIDKKNLQKFLKIFGDFSEGLHSKSKELKC